MTTPVTLYAIHTPVGQMARWLPSIDAAKQAYTELVAARDYEEDEPRPVVSFEVSLVDDQGDPCSEHVNCLLDGNLDCCIWPEPAAWPERDLYTYDGIVKAPNLVMVASEDRHLCAHRTLVFRNDVDHERSTPAIACDDCGATWQPAGFARADQ